MSSNVLRDKLFNDFYAILSNEFEDISSQDAHRIAKVMTKSAFEAGTVVMCADCHYWDGHENSMGICTLLPDERYVQVPIDNHVSLKLITADDFSCIKAKRN